MPYTATYTVAGSNAARGTTYLLFTLTGDYVRTWDGNVSTADLTSDPDAVLAQEVKRMLAIIDQERLEATRAAAYTEILAKDRVAVAKAQAAVEAKLTALEAAKAEA